MPARARRLAEYFGSVVAAVTSVELDEPLGVKCRRRPGRKPCPGSIEAWIEFEEERIVWGCLSCDDEGLISGWRGTFWDCSEKAGSDEPWLSS